MLNASISLYYIVQGNSSYHTGLGARKYSSNKYYDIWNLLMWTYIPVHCWLQYMM